MTRDAMTKVLSSALKLHWERAIANCTHNWDPLSSRSVAKGRHNDGDDMVRRVINDKGWVLHDMLIRLLLYVAAPLSLPSGPLSLPQVSRSVCGKADLQAR